MTRWMTPSRLFLALIVGAFLVAAAAYWFLGRYLDPVGTVLLLFVGGSIAFGFWVLLGSVAGENDE